MSRKNKSYILQCFFLVACGCLAFWLWSNLNTNLESRGLKLGYEFLGQTAGFPIAETPALPVFETGFLMAILTFVAIALGVAFFAAKRPAQRILPQKEFYKRLGLLLGIPVAIYACTSAITGDFAWGKFVTYDTSSSYLIAFYTGIVNTLKVSLVGMLFATALGFVAGIGRLSSNSLLSGLLSVFIGFARNVPLLLQLLLWYVLTLHAFPDVQNGFHLGDWLYLNNRGLFLADVSLGESLPQVAALALASLLALVVVSHEMVLREEISKQKNSRFLILSIIILSSALWGYFLVRSHLTLQIPEIVFGGRNIQGGIALTPEFVSLLFGLTFYTGAFIAEIVRSGLLAVPHGQREAARALGLSEIKTLRLIILPQAFRIMVPPLTSQYLNLLKNSSLAVAIGYPDMVSTGGTMLSQVGQSVEIIALWMVVYLSFSLFISFSMNIYNTRMRLVER
jgi:general L-amino acid transport system permease protein